MSHGSSGLTPQGNVPSTATARGLDVPSTNASAGPSRLVDAGGTVELPPDAVEKAINRSLCDSNLPVKERPPLQPEGYRIGRKLGEGTYGEVWKGEHARTGFQVAVKFLRARTSAQLLQLSEEAKKLAMLHSEPYVIRIIDLEEKTTPPYFVMDFAEHGSLAERLALGPLSPAAALALFRKIVEAMAYVHAKGIRHCDLKPGNILLDAADRPKVADFGQSHLSVEATQSALGTFFYMAPEQAAAEKRTPDARWDVFGLGALLYVMLTGEPPRFDRGFKHELEQTAQLSHRLERYRKWVESSPRPSGHRAVRGVDRALADIVDRCLSADPADRYADAGALLAALDAHERKRRSRPMVLFGILAPLLLVTGLAVAAVTVTLATYDAVNESNGILNDHKDRVDKMTAHLVADIVKDKLQDLHDRTATLAQNDKLKGPLLSHLARPNPKNVQAVEDFLGRLGIYESQIQMLTVYDTHGDLFAAWVRSPSDHPAHPKETYNKNFTFRDYWNHRGDDFDAPRKFAATAVGLVASPLGAGPLAAAAAASATGGAPEKPACFGRYKPYMEKGKVVPYLGQPFASALGKGFTAIPVSMPIYVEDPAKVNPAKVNPAKFVGLLVACVKLEQFNHWLKSTELGDANVVVLDKNGYCVHHRSKYQKDYEPKIGENPQRKSSPLYDIVLRGDKADINHEHRDPYEQDKDKVYSAAYVPVLPFGWGVIVEYDAVTEATKAKQRIADHLYWLGGIAVALSITLLLAFWGWLLWTLLRKESTPHA